MDQVPFKTNYFRYVWPYMTGLFVGMALAFLLMYDTKPLASLFLGFSNVLFDWKIGCLTIAYLLLVLIACRNKEDAYKLIRHPQLLFLFGMLVSFVTYGLHDLVARTVFSSTPALRELHATCFMCTTVFDRTPSLFDQLRYQIMWFELFTILAGIIIVITGSKVSILLLEKWRRSHEK